MCYGILFFTGFQKYLQLVVFQISEHQRYAWKNYPDFIRVRSVPSIMSLFLQFLILKTTNWSSCSDLWSSVGRLFSCQNFPKILNRIWKVSEKRLEGQGFLNGRFQEQIISKTNIAPEKLVFGTLRCFWFSAYFRGELLVSGSVISLKITQITHEILICPESFFRLDHSSYIYYCSCFISSRPWFQDLSFFFGNWMSRENSRGWHQQCVGTRVVSNRGKWKFCSGSLKKNSDGILVDAKHPGILHPNTHIWPWISFRY